MVILQDTREQKGLRFRSKNLEGVEKVKLDYGDYMVRFKDGTIPKVSFERKGIGDLFGTMGKGYNRFKKEIIRSQEDSALLIIIIEGTLGDVEQGIGHSKRPGGQVLSQLFTIMVRHHVPFICCKDRREMAKYIVGFFETLGREHIRKKNAREKI